jgi:hypothetical protein
MNDKRIKIGTDWAIIIVMVLIASCILFAVNAKVEPKPGMGILCDTQQQVENLAAHAETGFNPVEAIEAVNKDAGSAACGVIQFISSEIEVVHRMTVEGHDVVILKMTIVAVITPMGPMPADLVQFTIAAAEGFVPARLGI